MRLILGVSSPNAIYLHGTNLFGSRVGGVLLQGDHFDSVAPCGQSFGVTDHPVVAPIDGINNHADAAAGNRRFLGTESRAECRRFARQRLPIRAGMTVPD